MSQSSTAYYGNPFTTITGLAYPMIYENSEGSHDDVMTGFKITCYQPYQVCLYGDQDTAGYGPTDFTFTDVSLTSQGESNVYVQKSGFGFFFLRGAWNNTATDFSSPTAALFTDNCGTGQSMSSLSGIGYTVYTQVFGGMLVDTCGTTPGNPLAHWTFSELLDESSFVPVLRVNTYYGISNTDFNNVSYADPSGGVATPIIDLTNASAVAGIRAYNVACATSLQPVFETNSTSAEGLTVTNDTQGCAIMGTNYGAVRGQATQIDDYLSWNQRLQNTSHIAYQMSLPAAPASCVVRSGGSVPAGGAVRFVRAGGNFGFGRPGRAARFGPGRARRPRSGRGDRLRRPGVHPTLSGPRAPRPGPGSGRVMKTPL